jgi:hypothetical protein
MVMIMVVAAAVVVVVVVVMVLLCNTALYDTGPGVALHGTAGAFWARAHLDVTHGQPRAHMTVCWSGLVCRRLGDDCHCHCLVGPIALLLATHVASLVSSRPGRQAPPPLSESFSVSPPSASSPVRSRGEKSSVSAGLARPCPRSVAPSRIVDA